MPTRVGATEIIILALIILIFFGSRRLPEFIKGLGEAVREFKKSLKEE